MQMMALQGKSSKNGLELLLLLPNMMMLLLLCCWKLHFQPAFWRTPIASLL
jgi:hypothetical protein